MATGSAASSCSDEDTAKLFQAYLRKYENDDKLVILKVVNKPGSKLGDNYTSLLIRAEIVGTYGNGSRYDKSFMVKKQSNRPVGDILNISNLFRTEAYVYNKILPFLGPFGPKCVLADKEIIMEDLARKGYANCDRMKFLDLKHISFALKKLAQLHATSLAIKLKNSRLFHEMVEPLEEVIYNDENKAHMKLPTESCVTTTVDYLKKIEPQTPELENAAKLVLKYTEIYDTMCDFFKAPKNKYDTICHGDLWNNNLLFLHDTNGKILDLKMVDYQICRFTSVSTDILYLIYSSMHSSLIENNYESVIKIYHDEFIQELRQKSVDEKILAELGIDWLHAELHKYQLYGLVNGCFLLHAMLADEEDAKQFEEIKMDEDFGKNMININSEKIDRIRCIMLHYYRQYTLATKKSRKD